MRVCIAIGLVAVLVGGFQNCAFEDRPPIDQPSSQAPLPYDFQPDTLAYLSCSGQTSGAIDKEAVFSFYMASMASGSGVKLSTPMLEYLNDNFHKDDADDKLEFLKQQEPHYSLQLALRSEEQPLGVSGPDSTSGANVKHYYLNRKLKLGESFLKTMLDSPDSRQHHKAGQNFVFRFLPGFANSDAAAEQMRTYLNQRASCLNTDNNDCVLAVTYNSPAAREDDCSHCAWHYNDKTYGLALNLSFRPGFMYLNQDVHAALQQEALCPCTPHINTTVKLTGSGNLTEGSYRVDNADVVPTEIKTAAENTDTANEELCAAYINEDDEDIDLEGAIATHYDEDNDTALVRAFTPSECKSIKNQQIEQEAKHTWREQEHTYTYLWSKQVKTNKTRHYNTPHRLLRSVQQNSFNTDNDSTDWQCLEEDRWLLVRPEDKDQSPCTFTNRTGVNAANIQDENQKSAYNRLQAIWPQGENNSTHKGFTQVDLNKKCLLLTSSVSQVCYAGRTKIVEGLGNQSSKNNPVSYGGSQPFCGTYANNRLDSMHYHYCPHYLSICHVP